MEFDLCRQSYDEEAYSEYIYGSAEVVGLMCLYVFCEGDQKAYELLKPNARSLGSAFQKVNFLRDVKSDYFQLNRTVFPGVIFPILPANEVGNRTGYYA
jgi:phytoene/squalene synthetase